MDCKAGLYGVNCNQPCSQLCVPDIGNEVHCFKDTGNCRSLQCMPGYYGAQCIDACNDKCRPDTLDGLVYCNVSTGYCNQGCLDGWFGDSCDKPCADNCAGDINACARDGYCANGCENNKYGYYCGMTCDSTCIDDQCHRMEGYCLACNETTNNKLCRDAGIIKPCSDGFGYFIIRYDMHV